MPCAAEACSAFETWSDVPSPCTIYTTELPTRSTFWVVRGYPAAVQTRSDWERHSSLSRLGSFTSVFLGFAFLCFTFFFVRGRCCRRGRCGLRCVVCVTCCWCCFSCSRLTRDSVSSTVVFGLGLQFCVSFPVADPDLVDRLL